MFFYTFNVFYIFFNASSSLLSSRSHAAPYSMRNISDSSLTQYELDSKSLPVSSQSRSQFIKLIYGSVWQEKLFPAVDNIQCPWPLSASMFLPQCSRLSRTAEIHVKGYNSGWKLRQTTVTFILFIMKVKVVFSPSHTSECDCYAYPVVVLQAPPLSCNLRPLSTSLPSHFDMSLSKPFLLEGVENSRVFVISRKLLFCLVSLGCWRLQEERRVSRVQIKITRLTHLLILLWLKTVLHSSSRWSVQLNI